MSPNETTTINIVFADLTLDEHAVAFLTLMDVYANDPMGGGKALSDHTRSNLVAALLARTDVVILLAFHEQQTVGLMTCFEGFSTFFCQPLLNIHDVVVKSEWRGKGIGYQLLSKIQQVATARHCCKLTLEVLEGNTTARSLYQQFGFAPYVLDESCGQAQFWEKRIG